jgi:hypothetical protein
MNCSQGWVSLAPGLRAQEPAALCGVHRDKPLRDRDASLLPEMTTRTRLSGALRKLHQIRSKSQTQHQSVRQKLCHEKHVLHGVAMLFRMAMFYCATECSAGRRRGRSQTRTQPPPRHAPVLTRGQSLGSKRLRTTRRSRAGAARGGGTPCATSRAGRSAAWSGRTFFLHTATTASARIAVVRQGRRAKVASKNPSPPTQPPLSEQQLQVGWPR